MVNNPLLLHMHRSPSLQLTLLLIFSVVPLPHAHQSIAFPYPISHDVACRISNKQHCPGPCPRTDLRGDRTPNNPSVQVARGSWLTVNILANNHRGGFNRWTLVHVRDMHSKKRHAQNAFLWTCADTGLKKCSHRMRRRDCRFDFHNDHFTHTIQIPKIYPDGVYVLGWVWYGGGKRFGAFGDYYDCMYVKVRGGPLESVHQPIFKPGPTVSGEHGMCRATVNKIGVCWSEPCPGGGKMTELLRPAEFGNGARPHALYRSWFHGAYLPRHRRFSSPYVKSMTIRSSDYADRVYSKSTWTRTPYIMLTKGMGVTVTCEVTGHVKYVVFFINGRKGNVDAVPPYSIAGDWIEYKSGKVHYAPWKANIDRTVTTISCVAKGYDGTEHWENVELSTDF